MRSINPSSAAIKVFTVSAMFVAVALMVPSQGAGADFPKLIYGYVWDSAGRVVEGADVTVNMLRPDESVRTTLTDTTDATGGYLVSFDPTDWELGDTVLVIASFGGSQEPNETLPLTHSNPQMVNVTFAFEIPQFGSALGLAVAGGAVGIVAIVSLVTLRRRPSRKS